VAKREIQSVEVSCFVHATEDEDKVKEAIKGFLGIFDDPLEELLEGHFGNRIIRTTWHLTGDEAWKAFSSITTSIGTEGRAQIVKELSASVDSHGALYLRLSKQSIIRKSALISSSDPVRIRVKPRGFMMKGDPKQFYSRLLEATAA
jgi:RNA binding exosome subunit